MRPKALHALMLQLARLLLAWPLHVVVPAEQLSLSTLFLARAPGNWAEPLGLGGTCHALWVNPWQVLVD